jgi:hypothetical protein
MANIENLKRVVAHIEAHPETWNQSEWHCGTTHCLAGHAQIISGKKPDEDSVWPDAKKFLGLKRVESQYLFRPWRTLADFHAFINAGGIPE